MIKKIISSKPPTVPIYTNRLPTTKLSPKLSFFLLKKKFFLYKKIKQPGCKYTNTPGTTMGIGLYKPLESYLKKLRKHPQILHSMARRSYFYYKHKRRFRLLNKKNRHILFTYLKIYVKDKDKTRFILRTKNARKLDILRHVMNLRRAHESTNKTNLVVTQGTSEIEQHVVSYSHFMNKLSMNPRRTKYPTSVTNIRPSKRKVINVRVKKKKKTKYEIPV